MRTSDAAQRLCDELADRVAALRTSAEWLEAITAAARFHDYSFGNWLLLWSQAEQRETTVTRPAGYRTWQRLGRHVRRGELGYKILAPVTRRVSDDDEATGEERTRRAVVGFRVATVFDYRQTEGKPLPEVAPERLTGDDGAGLFEHAAGMIRAEGYTFELGRLGGPNGLTRPTERSVAVDDRLEPAQRAKTTVHELAHVLMHAGAEGFECRGRVEVEAESVAFCVCGVTGFDTSAYSVAYVAGWAEATPDPARALLASAERIVAISRRILETIRSPASIEIMHQTTV